MPGLAIILRRDFVRPVNSTLPKSLSRLIPAATMARMAKPNFIELPGGEPVVILRESFEGPYL